MRALILSDIHGNLEALQAVLQAALDDGGYDQLWNLGDMVGYGASPNQVLDLIRPISTLVVRGNHDRVCCGLTSPNAFNPVARAAAVWTRHELTEDNVRWLRDLPQGPVKPPPTVPNPPSPSPASTAPPSTKTTTSSPCVTPGPPYSAASLASPSSATPTSRAASPSATSTGTTSAHLFSPESIPVPVLLTPSHSTCPSNPRPATLSTQAPSASPAIMTGAPPSPSTTPPASPSPSTASPTTWAPRKNASWMPTSPIV